MTDTAAYSFSIQTPWVCDSAIWKSLVLILMWPIAEFFLFSAKVCCSIVKFSERSQLYLMNMKLCGKTTASGCILYEYWWICFSSTVTLCRDRVCYFCIKLLAGTLYILKATSLQGVSNWLWNGLNLTLTHRYDLHKQSISEEIVYF